MKWIKTALIVIVAVSLIGYGGLKVYGLGSSRGEQAGYDSGFMEGQMVGYESGEKVGYEQGQTDGYGAGRLEGYYQGEAEGYSSGKVDGYDEGYLKGEQDGRSAGYISGKQDGYEDGYQKGMEDSLGHGYTISDTTYADVLNFLGQDNTDLNEYAEGSYVCTHFARDVCNNAEDAGIRCAFVDLRYEESGHSVIAFNTIDQGMVYFEPQSDERVNPVIGKRYYLCIVPRPGYYYDVPDYDDTIQDILVIW